MIPYGTFWLKSPGLATCLLERRNARPCVQQTLLACSCPGTGFNSVSRRAAGSEKLGCVLAVMAVSEGMLREDSPGKHLREG